MLTADQSQHNHKQYKRPKNQQLLQLASARKVPASSKQKANGDNEIEDEVRGHKREVSEPQRG